MGWLAWQGEAAQGLFTKPLMVMTCRGAGLKQLLRYSSASKAVTKPATLSVRAWFMFRLQAGVNPARAERRPP